MLSEKSTHGTLVYQSGFSDEYCLHNGEHIIITGGWTGKALISDDKTIAAFRTTKCWCKPPEE